VERALARFGPRGLFCLALLFCDFSHKHRPPHPLYSAGLLIWGERWEGADMSNRSDDWREDLIKCVVMLPAMVSFGVGAIVLAYQAIQWLNHAVWPTVTLRDGFAWMVRPDADFACGVDVVWSIPVRASLPN
jgi:hypothetical protein